MTFVLDGSPDGSTRRLGHQDLNQGCTAVTGQPCLCESEGTMRKVLLTAVLAGCSSAYAQLQFESPTDAAACTRLIAPQARPMSPALTAAVQTTLGTYRAQVERFVGPLATRPPSLAERRQLDALGREAVPYLRRLLSTYGWPNDPAIRASLTRLLNEPEMMWCVGQVALSVATSLEERQQAARLIDGGLIGLGGKQRYGTATKLVGRTVKPLALEEPQQVDARRAAAGLPPLAKDLAQLQSALPPRTPPAGLRRPVVLRPVCQRFTNTVALNTPLTHAQLDILAREADRLVEQDQASRRGEPGARRMNAVDAESTAWLKSVLKKYGWPSTNRGDPQLALNAWLLAQHADAANDLQDCILDLIGQQQTTQAEAQNLAYLTDRVRLAQGEPQLYGTQVSYDSVRSRATPRMLADPERVNERRARIGLESIEEYLKRFEPPRP